MATDRSTSSPTWFFRPPRYYSVRNWLKHYFGGLYYRADEHHIFLLSGGLAFSVFVCVVPIVLVMFSVLGSMLERSALENELTSLIDRVIPYQTYSTTVKQFILDRINEFRTYRKVAGYVGVIGLLLAASTLFSSMRTVLNRVFATTVEKHVLVGKLRDFGMIVLVLIYVLLSITLLPLLEIIRSSASEVELFASLKLGTLEVIALWLVSLGVIFGVFSTLYLLVPYAKLEKRVILVGAFWATVLWEIARQGFGYYISHVATLKAIYGTYLFLIVAAFWIYYSSIAFTIGAEIGQLYRERRELYR